MSQAQKIITISEKTNADPLQVLAAATLAQAIADLQSKNFSTAARAFLYGEIAQCLAGVLGLDHVALYNRMKRYERRHKIQVHPLAPLRQRPGPKRGVCEGANMMANNVICPKP